MISSGFRATPVPGGANGIALLALATLLAFSLSFACNAAQGDNSTAPVNLEQSLTDTDVSEGSRALGGIPVKPFPWLMNMWALPAHRYDGFYAGFGMRIKNDTFLAADASCHAVEKWAWNHRMKEVFELKAPEKIDVSAGPNHEWRRRLGCSHYVSVGIRTGFSVYQLKMHSKYKISSYIYPHDIKEGVPFQNDPKVDKDCYLYAYSSNPTKQQPRKATRIFRKYAVKLIRCDACDNGYCKFEFHRVANESVGRVCPLLSNAGAPIICEGKVSFVVDEQRGNYCRQSFSALKLAPHLNDLKPPPPKILYKGPWFEEADRDFPWSWFS